MEEILIYYEEEVRVLRDRVKKQNTDISAMCQQLELSYRLYANLEDAHNKLKEDYEKFKTECSLFHTTSNKENATVQYPPEFEL
jgi:hypothetical protein